MRALSPPPLACSLRMYAAPSLQPEPAFAFRARPFYSHPTAPLPALLYFPSPPLPNATQVRIDVKNGIAIVRLDQKDSKVPLVGFCGVKYCNTLLC